MKNIDETISTVFDRMENYKAAKKRKQKIAAAIAIPICSCCLLAVIGFGIGKFMNSPSDTSNTPVSSSKQTISGTMPSDRITAFDSTLPTDKTPVSDPTLPSSSTTNENKIIIFSADGVVEQQMGIALFCNDFISMSDEEMIAYYGSNIFPEIPVGMSARIKHLGIYKKENGKGDVYWDQNRQEYSDESQTKSIVVDTRKGSLPFYDFVDYDPKTQSSAINGHEVAIGQYSDGGYSAWFLYNNVGFHIYARGITQWELVCIIESLIV